MRHRCSRVIELWALSVLLGHNGAWASCVTQAVDVSHDTRYAVVRLIPLVY